MSKWKKCLSLFCNNRVCAECEEGEFCALCRLVKNTLGESEIHRDYAKRK